MYAAEREIKLIDLNLLVQDMIWTCQPNGRVSAQNKPIESTLIEFDTSLHLERLCESTKGQECVRVRERERETEKRARELAAGSNTHHQWILHGDAGYDN